MFIQWKTILLRQQYYPKQTDLMRPCIKIILVFFAILEFTCNYNRTQMAKEILKKNDKIGTLTLPDFKTYCQSYGQKMPCTDIIRDIKSNGIEQSQNKCRYLQPIDYNKGTKAIQ